MHTHKLIRLIRARPMLYNFEMEDYNNKLIAERKWSEIAIEMNASVSECKTKWNSLRTAFNTYLNKLKRMKKPRTKWIHADEMEFLKQYLKRNRYSLSSSSTNHSNDDIHNNNDLNNLNDSNETTGFLMTLTTMKSSNDDDDTTSFNQLTNPTIEYCYNNNNGKNQQSPSISSSSSPLPSPSTSISSPTSPTSPIINLSKKRSRNSTTYNRSIMTNYCGGSVGGEHVDVETCDDNDINEIDDDNNNNNNINDIDYDDDDDNDNEYQHFNNKKHKTSISGNHNNRFNIKTTETITNCNGEKLKRITIEAPESMYICFDLHHHNNNDNNNQYLNQNQNQNSSSIKWPPKSLNESLNGNEMNIFADYVAMKLKTFTLANRLETMTKIWHLLSEITLRQYSTSTTTSTSLPPPSLPITPQSLNSLLPLVAINGFTAPPPPPPLSSLHTGNNNNNTK